MDVVQKPVAWTSEVMSGVHNGYILTQYGPTPDGNALGAVKGTTHLEHVRPFEFQPASHDKAAGASNVYPVAYQELAALERDPNAVSNDAASTDMENAPGGGTHDYPYPPSESNIRFDSYFHRRPQPKCLDPQQDKDSAPANPMTKGSQRFQLSDFPIEPSSS